VSFNFLNQLICGASSICPTSRIDQLRIDVHAANVVEQPAVLQVSINAFLNLRGRKRRRQSRPVYDVTTAESVHVGKRLRHAFGIADGNDVCQSQERQTQTAAPQLAAIRSCS
jgi:hypothetical protein